MCFGSDKTARPAIIPQPAMIKKILLFFAFVYLSAHVFAAPAHVVIRVPTGTPQPAALAPLLAKWRESGLISDCLLLTRGQPEKPGDLAIFETFAVLELPGEDAAERWQRDAAPLLPAGLRVRRADILVHGEISPRDSQRSVFVVNTYTTIVPRDHYDEFAQAYLKPLYEGQRAAGVLVRHTMFLERDVVGQADALAVLEYRDSDALQAAVAIKLDLRRTLTASNPGYVKFDPVKATLRKDVGGTFASLTELPSPAAARAILISVDGMHAIDLALWVKNNPDSAFARLSQRGVTYTNARTPLLGDSTPGLVSLATGATPATAGLIYSPFFDRSLIPAGAPDGTKGALYTIDEKWVLDMTREDSGGGIDEKKLPRDPAKGNAPVYPHDLMRVNTMFEVVRAAGGRTAWIDQHILYNDLLNGPSSKGLDDSIALERKGTPQTFEGFTAQDKRRVEILLNQIRGFDSGGKNKAGVPKLFGMGFISFGALQKSEGYANAAGDIGSKKLRAALQLVDDSLGRIVAELKQQNLYDSTLLIVSSKHGQSPIDVKQRRLIDRNVIREAVNGVQPDLLAHAALDSIGLIYLRDSAKTDAVAEALRARAAEAGILKVYHGEQLKLFLPTPEQDPRMPDILIQPVLGAFYADYPNSPVGKALLAEHGGMLDEDVNVPLLVSFAGAPGTVSRAPVFTHQVAPTILSALGLDPAALRGVQIEGTPVLPGLKWNK